MRQAALEIFIILSLLLLLSLFCKLLSISTTIYVNEAKLNFVKTVCLRVSKSLYDVAYSGCWGTASEILSFRTDATDIYIAVGTGWLLRQGLQPSRVYPPSFTETLQYKSEIEANVEGPCTITFSTPPLLLKIDGSEVAPGTTVSIPSGTHYVYAVFNPTTLTVSVSGGTFWIVVSGEYSNVAHVVYNYPSVRGLKLEVEPYNGYLTAFNLTATRVSDTVRVSIRPMGS